MYCHESSRSSRLSQEIPFGISLCVLPDGICTLSEAFWQPSSAIGVNFIDIAEGRDYDHDTNY